ncbi:MAG: hypothetical protein K0S86_4027 [Geminicoccaceae bacterium]|jgi:hypothetical protein|nr:hypothetical protein [Geminicoccaceae bacterium]
MNRKAERRKTFKGLAPFSVVRRLIFLLPFESNHA